MKIVRNLALSKIDTNPAQLNYQFEQDCLRSRENDYQEDTRLQAPLIKFDNNTSTL